MQRDEASLRHFGAIIGRLSRGENLSREEAQDPGLMAAFLVRTRTRQGALSQVMRGFQTAREQRHLAEPRHPQGIFHHALHRCCPLDGLLQQGQGVCRPPGEGVRHT